MTGEYERQLWRQMLARSFCPSDWFAGARDGSDGDGGDIMWVYRKVDDGFEVGYYTPSKEWVAESTASTREEAAGRVHWLNGGN